MESHFFYKCQKLEFKLLFLARKKTTELSKILSKMERNRLSDAREKAAAASASKSKQ